MVSLVCNPINISIWPIYLSTPTSSCTPYSDNAHMASACQVLLSHARKPCYHREDRAMKLWISMRIDHGTWTSLTDRQTDGRTVGQMDRDILWHDRTLASRGKNTEAIKLAVTTADIPFCQIYLEKILLLSTRTSVFLVSRSRRI